MTSRTTTVTSDTPANSHAEGLLIADLTQVAVSGIGGAAKLGQSPTTRRAP